MELNVRSFLQVSGKVNKGIRTTLIEEPNMFLHIIMVLLQQQKKLNLLLRMESNT